MGAALALLAPVIVPLLTELFKPKHQPTAEEADQFPRPNWLPEGVNWAVTGQAGSGKSGLINGMRNVRKTAPEAAPEGSSETTMDPTPYPFPQNNSIKLWDLPGGGTPRHPQESYAKDKGIRWFHGVVVCIKDGRPTQFDIHLVQMLEAFKVPYYVVQNRFQHAADGEDIDVDDASAVSALANQVKNQVHRVFVNSGCAQCQASRIFMINSRKFDFAHGQQFKDNVFQDLMANRSAS